MSCSFRRGAWEQLRKVHVCVVCNVTEASLLFLKNNGGGPLRACAARPSLSDRHLRDDEVSFSTHFSIHPSYAAQFQYPDLSVVSKPLGLLSQNIKAHLLCRLSPLLPAGYGEDPTNRPDRLTQTSVGAPRKENAARNPTEPSPVPRPPLLGPPTAHNQHKRRVACQRAAAACFFSRFSPTHVLQLRQSCQVREIAMGSSALWIILILRPSENKPQKYASCNVWYLLVGM